MAQKKRMDHARAVLRVGEGQRKDGAYYYRWTERGKRHTIYAPNLNLRREREEEIKKNKAIGIKAESRYITLNDIYELWKETKVGLRDTTMKGYCYAWEMFVKDDLGKMRLSMIEKSDVKRFYNRLYNNRSLQIATIDNVHTVLHQVLQIAVDDHMIQGNPASGALRDLKRCDKRQEKRHALSIEEEKLFLEFLKGSETFGHWYPIFAVMLGTGLRVGEITALRWCDLDWKEEMINVSHTLVYYDHGNKDNGKSFYCNIHETKTDAGNRSIPMLKSVKEALLLEKQWQEENKITCTVTVDGYTDFIFVNRFGHAQNQATINQALKRITRNCNFEILEKNENAELLLPRFSSHILRHTFATRMCEAGIHPKVLQTIMGHSDIQTTMNIYADATDSFKKEQVREAEKKFIEIENRKREHE